MCARRDLRGAVCRSEWVEKCQRRNRLDDAGTRFVTMDRLRTAAGAGFAPFDLRQKKRLLQDMIGGGQHLRQAADKLHRWVEIELGMAPVGAAWHWLFGRWPFASLEG